MACKAWICGTKWRLAHSKNWYFYEPFKARLKYDEEYFMKPTVGNLIHARKACYLSVRILYIQGRPEAMLFERLEFNCWFKIYERNWKLAVVKILYNYFPLREFSNIFFELVFKNFVRKQIFHSCYNIDLVILIDFYIPKTWKHLKKVDLNIGETKTAFCTWYCAQQKI